MISELDSSFLRGLLRVYFILAFIILGLIGSQCCKSSVKLGLLHGQSIRLNKMTGWISGPSLIKAIWQLRRLPGGVFFGLLMITASIMTLVADFATSTLVYQTNVYDRCNFDMGLVIDHTKEWWIVPPPNSAAAVVASTAQRISILNGGYIGIYNKAGFSLDFSAEERDLMGWWTCTEEIGKDVTYASFNPATTPDGLTDEAISDDLLARGLQYPSAWMVRDISDVAGTAHLIAWSASVLDGDRKPFNVKVSIDQGDTYGIDKTMKNYICGVDPNSYELGKINTILSTMQATATLKEWVFGLPATIYNGLGSFPNTANTTNLLAQTLNTLTMVQGGLGSIMEVPKPEDDHTYGCLVTKTSISIVVIALACAVGAALLGMFIWWIIMLFRIRAHSLPFRKSGSKRSAIRPVPDGLVAWMLQATRESTFGQQEKQYGRVNMDIVPENDHQTKDWTYKVVDDGSDPYARLTRAGGTPLPIAEQAPSPGYTGYPPPPGQWDPKHGGQYGVVPQNDGRYIP